MSEVAEALSLRDIPVPTFQDISLDEQGNAQRLYTRLAELGLLTPDEFFQVSETGIFPTKEDSITNQAEYKKQREDGLYLPLIGGSSTQDQQAAEQKAAGRPAGTKAPQKTKKVSPQKSVGSQVKFSDIQSSASKVSALIEAVEKEYKTKNKIQRLSNKHKSIAFDIAKSIIGNENISNWESKCASYVENPVPPNGEIASSIDELAAEHDLDYLSAALLFHSKNEQNQD
jgi:hypothetical protein